MSSDPSAAARRFWPKIQWDRKVRRSGLAKYKPGLPNDLTLVRDRGALEVITRVMAQRRYRSLVRLRSRSTLTQECC